MHLPADRFWKRSSLLNRRSFLAAGGLAVAGTLVSESSAQTQTGMRHRTESRNVSLLPLFPLAQPTHDAFAALMAYEPARDPDAAYFRSLTPRAARIAPFAATQAHPKLDPRPRVASLSTCYSTLAPHSGEENYHQQRYGRPPEGGVYVSRFFTYHDILVQWSGTGQIPNPAMTDVAHRNGAYCLGTIFQPDHRVYDSSTVPARKVAAKFAELAEYFGFDGYFFNFEAGTPEGNAQVHTLMGLMREEAAARGVADFQVQFYDGHTNMDGLLPVHGKAGQSYATSTMLDQGWSAYGGPGHCCSGGPVEPADVYRYCTEHGFDPFADAYFGLQLYPGPGYLDAVAPEVIHPNDGAYAYGSLQLYSVEDGLQNQLRADKPAMTPSAVQAELYALERQFFSGKSQNPARDNLPDAAEARAYLPNKQVTNPQSGAAHNYHFYTDRAAAEPKPTDQTNLPITYGVANFVVEHSVIGSFPFVSRFNVGEGQMFYLAGEVVSEEQWFNLGIQDLLPTWQWWVEPMAGRRHWQEQDAAKKLSIEYDQAIAYDGGSSLHLSGTLNPGEGAQVRLYKTALQVGTDADLRLHLVTNGADSSAGQTAVLQLGILFEDTPDTPAWFPLHTGDAMQQEVLTNGWIRSTLELKPFAGRSIAALLLGVRGSKASATAIDMHVGELYLGPPPPRTAPPALTGLSIEAHVSQAEGKTADVRLRWKRGDRPAMYDIFCLNSSGAAGPKKNWLGRIEAEAFYAASVPLDAGGSARLELTATYTGAPLTPSAPATVTLRA
jgi:endo-beta-N-acetylglucosaminidase D